MAVANPPYVLQNRADHPAVALRRMLAAAVLSPGVPAIGTSATTGQCAVTQQGSPNMSVLVATGHSIVPCFTSGAGHYAVYNDAPATLAIGAAHASLTRWDLVVWRVQDQEQAGAVNTGDLFVVQGTPSGTPADPALPAGASYLLLARVVVIGGATSIDNAHIQDLRVRSGGTGVPTVCTSGTRPANPGRGDFIYETDTDRVYFWSASRSVWVRMSTSDDQGLGLVAEDITASCTFTGATAVDTGLLVTVDLIAGRKYEIKSRAFWTTAAAATPAGRTILTDNAGTAFGPSNEGNSGYVQTLGVNASTTTVNEQIYRPGSTLTAQILKVQINGPSGQATSCVVSGGYLRVWDKGLA
jgi:hypothetical protein